MIRPVNGHILIEPVEYKSLMASEKGQYQEIGTVVETLEGKANKGDRVFFDAWRAGKYEKEGGGYLWLVSWEDVKAVESNDP